MRVMYHLACEPQTYFRRESDDRKYVIGSQAML